MRTKIIICGTSEAGGVDRGCGRAADPRDLASVFEDAGDGDRGADRVGPGLTVLKDRDYYKAPALRESAGRLAERARAETWIHEEFLVACLQREVAARDAHGGEGRMICWSSSTPDQDAGVISCAASGTGSPGRRLRPRPRGDRHGAASVTLSGGAAGRVSSHAAQAPMMTAMTSSSSR
jgi:hypothetical protein